MNSVVRGIDTKTRSSQSPIHLILVNLLYSITNPPRMVYSDMH